MRLLGFLLALFSLAQPVRAEADWLVCRMTGAAMRACCCPEKDAPAHSAITRAGCCDAVHVESAAPASIHVDATPASIAPIVAVAGFVAAQPAFTGATRNLVALQRQDTTGPPRIPVFLNVRHILG